MELPKKAFFGRFPSLPPIPPPPQKRRFYLYCRLAVSEILATTVDGFVDSCSDGYVPCVS